MVNRLKIGFYQGYHGEGLPIDIAEKATESKPDIFCLPEYFFVKQTEQSILDSVERHDMHLQYLLDLSIRLNCVIAGGTLLISDDDKLRNRCYYIDKGSVIGHYDKIHLYRDEGRGQVKPGVEYKVFGYQNLRIGILVCADVLFESSFYNIKGLKPDVIIVPVISPFKEGETSEDKYKRDERLWVNGAKITGCPIIKIGSVGKIAGKKVQGRSLLAGSERIEFRVAPEAEEKPLLKFLDLSL